LKAAEISGERSVAGCQAIGMGRLAWDRNQVNRSMCVRVRDDYDELDVFRAANMLLGKSRIIKTKKAESLVGPASPVPELIAANLAAERHWCSGFQALVGDSKGFRQILYAKGGLRAMKEAVKNIDDQIVIDAFHDAWRRTMGALGERARREG